MTRPASRKPWIKQWPRCADLPLQQGRSNRAPAPRRGFCIWARSACGRFAPFTPAPQSGHPPASPATAERSIDKVAEPAGRRQQWRQQWQRLPSSRAQSAASILPVGGGNSRQHSTIHPRNRTTFGNEKCSGGATWSLEPARCRGGSGRSSRPSRRVPACTGRSNATDRDFSCRSAFVPD